MHYSQRSLFLQHLAQTSPNPLCIEIEKAEGHYIYDNEGKKYLDLISGISVCNLGHSHPAIVQAVQRQAATYMHTMVYGELIQSPQVKLAEKLVEVLPGSLDSCYLVNSGSEAIEGAMKLAKRATGRSGFVALQNAYHGSTQGALSLMSDEYFSSAFRPLLPNIAYIPQNNWNAIAAIGTDTAAVCMELIQAEIGALPCDIEFVKAVHERCRQTGTLLIIDEIQTGMGRTGTLFAFEQYQIVPDILVLGKAFGGGMPLGAFIASRELMQKLTHDPVLGHITTFGGHPVSCAAALTALDLTIHMLPGLAIKEKEAKFKSMASELGLGSITGRGLLLALDLGSAERCKKVIDICISQGLFTDWFLFAPHKLRMAPPLTIEFDEIEFAMHTIADAVKNSF